MNDVRKDELPPCLNDPEQYDLPPGGVWVDAFAARKITGHTRGAFYNFMKQWNNAVEYHDAKPMATTGIRQNRVRFYDLSDIERIARNRVGV